MAAHTTDKLSRWQIFKGMFCLMIRDNQFAVQTPWFLLSISDRAPWESGMMLVTGIEFYWKPILMPLDNPHYYEWARLWRYNYSRISLYDYRTGRVS